MMSIREGMILASMTACIGVEEVMLDTVQQASAQISTLADERTGRSAGKAPSAMTACVCKLSLVMISPIE
jgi:hypothetical protein